MAPLSAHSPRFLLSVDFITPQIKKAFQPKNHGEIIILSSMSHPWMSARSTHLSQLLPALAVLSRNGLRKMSTFNLTIIYLNHITRPYTSTKQSARGPGSRHPLQTYPPPHPRHDSQNLGMAMFKGYIGKGKRLLQHLNINKSTPKTLSSAARVREHVQLANECTGLQYYM